MSRAILAFLLLAVLTSNSDATDTSNLENERIPTSTATSVMMAEGGPIQLASTSDLLPKTTKTNSTIVIELSTTETITEEQRTPPRKQQKIVPRKGAERQLATEGSVANDTKPVVEPSTEDTHVKDPVKPLQKEPMQSSTVTQDTQTNTLNNTQSNNVSSSTETLTNVTVKEAKLVKKPKPKPTVTIGEAEVDKPIPASPTKGPPVGVPKKMDYIVPVVLTIVPLPFLAVAAFVLYRRGRDCWDKRHYRRMDFLIDGMYND